MPFTASHPAAVLPFLGRAGLVPAALVIGSMAPDLPYYLQLGSDPALTHSAAGLVTVDLLLGLVAFIAWQGLVAPAAYVYAPSAVRARVGAPFPVRSCVSGPATIGLVLASLLLGSATHLVWDAFTHDGRWGTELIPWLTADHGPLPGYRWAQYVSTVFGLVATAWFLARRWRHTSPSEPAATATPGPGPRAALTFWAVVVGAAVIGGLAGLADALASDDGLRRGTFRAATWGGGFALVVLLAGSARYANAQRG